MDQDKHGEKKKRKGEGTSAEGCVTRKRSRSERIRPEALKSSITGMDLLRQLVDMTTLRKGARKFGTLPQGEGDARGWKYVLLALEEKVATSPIGGRP